MQLFDADVLTGKREGKRLKKKKRFRFFSFSRHQTTGATLVVFHSLFTLFLAQQATEILYFSLFRPRLLQSGMITVSSLCSRSTQLLTDLQVQRIGQQQQQQ